MQYQSARDLACAGPEVSLEYMTDEELRQIFLQKKKIRKEVLEKRSRMSPRERAAASLQVTDRILGHQWFYLARNVLCFASFGSEIDTGGILEETLSQGKKLYLPRVELLHGRGNPSMNFYQVSSFGRLVKGYQGIREPDGKSERFCFRPQEADRTLMLMPGVAFDPMRNRLGYGRGFYDRYLAAVEDPLKWQTIALGFACQLVEHIPCCGTDIKPYQILLK